MDEQLQHLLDKLKKDGVEKARGEADKIVSKARSESERITDEASRKAEDIVAQATREAEALVENGKVSLQQAARDAVLAVGNAVTATFDQLVRREVKDAISSEQFAEVITNVIQSYADKFEEQPAIEILVNKKDKDKIADYLNSKLSAEIRNGLEVKGDDSVVAGFKVSLVDDKIEHDFTFDAVAEALCSLLRPQMAEVVKKSMKESQEK